MRQLLRRTGSAPQVRRPNYCGLVEQYDNTKSSPIHRLCAWSVATEVICGAEVNQGYDVLPIKVLRIVIRFLCFLDFTHTKYEVPLRSVTEPIDTSGPMGGIIFVISGQLGVEKASGFAKFAAGVRAAETA